MFLNCLIPPATLNQHDTDSTIKHSIVDYENKGFRHELLGEVQKETGLRLSLRSRRSTWSVSFENSLNFHNILKS